MAADDAMTEPMLSINSWWLWIAVQ